MRFRGRVRVMPRSGLLDPQGHAVEQALGALGFATVSQVRVGRTLEIALDADSEHQVRERLREMCERLVANPVTEDYTIDAVEALA
ncbi:MAG: phosphoribosylformylglycinamidine synthase subunit PurS [Gemmatimonadales bacterium]|jgi:phosphoribosylformylglycinamidine synthase|nr:phosphoribosylformylglycinamidine synthase subunit PurS [Gemmatimonadales bacterium]